MTLRREKIEKVSDVEVLIISNKFDFTTDYVCVELEKRKVNYLRLNRDNFHSCKIEFNINLGELLINVNQKNYLVRKGLKSVYYRAPTYFRETFSKALSPEDQLYNSQWMSFIRNLTFFEDARWMNNPVDTYKAENKLLQLKQAREVVFRIPNTLVTNNNSFKFDNSTIAIKSLDTALFKINDQEAFFYTNIMEFEDVKSYDISLFPVIIQDNLEPKVDYRVTIAGNKIYSAAILAHGKGISGDWRRRKNTLNFIDCILPDRIKEKCFKLLKSLRLSFGGIDLVEHDNEFFFIEVNPTGEWAWLVDSANQKIYKGICDFLS